MNKKYSKDKNKTGSDKKTVLNDQLLNLKKLAGEINLLINRIIEYKNKINHLIHKINKNSFKNIKHSNLKISEKTQKHRAEKKQLEDAYHESWLKLQEYERLF